MLLSIWLPLHFQLDEYQVYSWYGFSCTIFFFVFGIILPRQATRLCIQMGVSRRTAYLSLYLMAAVASLCMAVAGQVLMLIGNAVADQTPFGTGLQDFLVGLFQTLYRNGGTMTALDQALAVVFTAFCMLALFSFGLFFTFLFWRLSKVGCIVAALAIPVVLTGCLHCLRLLRRPSPLLPFCCSRWGSFLLPPLGAESWFSW